MYQLCVIVVGATAPPPAIGQKTKNSLGDSNNNAFGGDFFITAGEDDSVSKNKEYR